MPPKENNPFYHRGPVREPEYFFGRARETGYLFELLRQGQNVAVCGPRRIGKTSLLFQVQHSAIRETNGLPEADARFLSLDGGTLDGLDEESFYGAVDRGLGGSSDSLPYPAFLDRLRDLFGPEGARRLVVFIDEFELVAANPRFGLSMFNRLRGLTSQHPLQFVTASKRPLWQLTISNRETLSSPFFNIFAPLPLGLLEAPEATEMLTTLSGRHGKPFTEDCCGYLRLLAGMHPLFLQVAAFRAFEAVSAAGTLTDDIRTTVRERALSDLEPHFSYYWNELAPDQRYELAALPLLGAPSQELAESGLIREGRYTGTMVEEFVRRQAVDGLLQAGPFLLDLRRSQTVVAGESVHLTPTEYSLLRLFLERPGRILTPEDIEAALWPQDQSPDPERARGVVKKLRAALGEAGQYLENRRGQGYLLVVH